jgi:hypothetical protein
MNSWILLQSKSSVQYRCLVFGGKTYLIEVYSNRMAEYLNSNSNTRRYSALLQLFPVISGIYTAKFGKILDISPADKHNPCSTKIPPQLFDFWLSKTENIFIVA